MTSKWLELTKNNEILVTHLDRLIVHSHKSHLTEDGYEITEADIGEGNALVIQKNVTNLECITYCVLINDVYVDNSVAVYEHVMRLIYASGTPLVLDGDSFKLDVSSLPTFSDIEMTGPDTIKATFGIHSVIATLQKDTGKYSAYIDLLTVSNAEEVYEHLNYIRSIRSPLCLSGLRNKGIILEKV